MGLVIFRIFPECDRPVGLKQKPSPQGTAESERVILLVARGDFETREIGTDLADRGAGTGNHAIKTAEDLTEGIVPQDGDPPHLRWRGWRRRRRGVRNAQIGRASWRGRGGSAGGAGAL